MRPRYKPAEDATDIPAEANGGEERGQVSMIGSDVTVTGNIEATDDLVIEGRVNGDVKCSTLIIGESGHVVGNVNTDRLRLSGQIEGTVTTGDLAVESGARISGEIAYSRMRVASGGVIEGQITHHPEENLRSDATEQRAPEPNQPQPARPTVIDAKIERLVPQDIPVFEDSSYRDAQRASG